MKHLEGLNEVQRLAVEYSEGPQLIIAGAGSGKTRVLTVKIVHLIKSGFDPSNILSLTFTNKAAREMQERMKNLIEAQKVAKLWMGTFHSIFARILRKEAMLIGYPSNFTIYDTDDSKRLLKEIIKDLKLDPDNYPTNEIYSRISKAKNNLILPSAYLNNAEIQKNDKILKRPETAKIYITYQNRMKKAAAMDFDDLLVNTNILLRDFPEILKKYQNQFKYILVDEYQDTNFAQYIIVKKLSALHQKICVVGDDSQSIYSFRGAKIENILNFQKDFKNYKLFKLEKNYRSTKNIVNLANSLIEKNKNRIPKTIFTSNSTGNKTLVKEHQTDKHEAIFVAKQIIKLKNQKKLEYNDFAILYRTNSQSRILEDILNSYYIPYKLFGAISFYQRAEIKNIVAYLRLLINKNDDQALKRIINYPKRGIGNTTIERLKQLSLANKQSLWETMQQLPYLNGTFNASTITKLKKFVDLIKLLDEQRQEQDLNQTVQNVLKKTGIEKTMLEDHSPEGINKYQNVNEFVNAIKQYTEQNEEQDNNEQKNISLEQFLEEIALATDQDTDDNNQNRVSLMTVHASKGLEFKIVFIVGMEEGLFPSYRSIYNPKDIEEERRLFYVAITRCETELFINYTKKRMKWGKQQIASPSRFIAELDKKYIDLQTSTQEKFENKEDYNNFAKQNKINAQPKISVSNPKKENLKPFAKATKNQMITKERDEETGISIGMNVEHAKFGIGKVLKIEGNYPNTKALVEFQNFGQKNLLLKFAKLKKI